MSSWRSVSGWTKSGGIRGFFQLLPRRAAAVLRKRALGGPIGWAISKLATPLIQLLTPKRLSKQEKKLGRFLRIKAAHRRGRERKREQSALAATAVRSAREVHLAGLDDEARAETERLRREAYLAMRKEQDDAKAAMAARLVAGLVSGVRVAVDVAYNELMSEKEQKSLARQLGFAYAVNRKLETPFSLHVCGLSSRTAHTLPGGFERWHVRAVEEEACAHFPLHEIIYLTPDSPNTLTSFDERSVYVIGGLVDGTIKKTTSLSRAERFGVRTARLPIEEHAMEIKPVLTINSVFHLLAAFRDTGDWAAAIGGAELAKRSPACYNAGAVAVPADEAAAEDTVEGEAVSSPR
ncbi:guanine-1-methyltransferase-domain-containing protein [Pavlovales sp. CCMP2436]|nr:guanine-1-methyltransferase-domain-containing protein [Pavlovales sp. CCMP2436]